jgi:hypothetical protein
VDALCVTFGESLVSRLASSVLLRGMKRRWRGGEGGGERERERERERDVKRPSTNLI